MSDRVLVRSVQASAASERVRDFNVSIIIGAEPPLKGVLATNGARAAIEAAGGSVEA